VNELFEYDSLAAGSKGLVYVGDKILVYRRDDKAPTFPLTIDLPGGGPEKDETPFETFQREIKEEFNLVIKPEDVVYHRRYPSILSKGKFGHFVVVKLPESEAKNIVFGDEGLEYMLMTLDEFIELDDSWKLLQDMAKEYRKTLE
jgi:8-oxo-dGTP diphosphatase